MMRPLEVCDLAVLVGVQALELLPSVVLTPLAGLMLFVEALGLLPMDVVDQAGE